MAGTLRPRFLYLAGFCCFSAQGRFMSLFLAQYCGLDEAAVGQMLALPSLLTAAAPVLWALLAERRGLRPVLVLCAAGSSAIFSAALVPSVRASFMAMLLVRCGASVLMSGMSPLMDAFCLESLQAGEGLASEDEAPAGPERDLARKSLYGRERLWGAVSWALCHLALGWLLDAHGFVVMPISSLVATALFCALLWWGAHRAQPVRLSPADSCADGLELTSPAAAAGAPAAGTTAHAATPADGGGADLAATGRDETMAGFYRDLFLHPYHASFVATIFLISAGSSLVEGLVFLFFKNELAATNLLMGLSVVVTVAFEVPFFQVGSQITKLLGGDLMLVLGLLAYASRVVLYTLVPADSIGLLLLIEPLHGVTYSLNQLSSVLHVTAMAPAGKEKVAQGTLSSIKALGTATGALLGALAMERFGPVAVYRGAGAIVFAQTVLFAAMTRCFRPRPEAPRYARLQGPSDAAQGTMPVE